MAGRSRSPTLPDALAETEVLVTCTGARDLFLDADQLRGTPVRGVVDLALPADVSEEVVELGITLVNLAGWSPTSSTRPASARSSAARDLVASEVQDFLGCAAPRRSPRPWSPCGRWPQKSWLPS